MLEVERKQIIELREKYPFGRARRIKDHLGLNYSHSEKTEIEEEKHRKIFL